MVTWMQVIEMVRRLDERRKRGEHLGEQDADVLVTMVLDFHEQAVEKVPTPSRPSLSAAARMPRSARSRR